MSSTEKSRTFRASQGRSRAGAVEDPETFAVEIARALARDYGDAASKVKVVARLTRSNERTVKNWFGGRNGPSGASLVILMRHSDEVLRTTLRLAGREDLLVALEVARARSQLRETMSAIDRILGTD